MLLSLSELLLLLLLLSSSLELCRRFDLRPFDLERAPDLRDLDLDLPLRRGLEEERPRFLLRRSSSLLVPLPPLSLESLDDPRLAPPPRRPLRAGLPVPLPGWRRPLLVGSSELSLSLSLLSLPPRPPERRAAGGDGRAPPRRAGGEGRPRGGGGRPGDLAGELEEGRNRRPSSLEASLSSLLSPLEAARPLLPAPPREGGGGRRPTGRGDRRSSSLSSLLSSLEAARPLLWLPLLGDRAAGPLRLGSSSLLSSSLLCVRRCVGGVARRWGLRRRVSSLLSSELDRWAAAPRRRGGGGRPRGITTDCLLVRLRLRQTRAV